jgi:transcriptional regulator with XRE-family HTH domain
MINRILEIISIEKNQADFCKKTGIGSSKLAYWLKNPQSSPNIDAIVPILEAYNVSADWLIRGVGDKFTKSNDIFSKNEDINPNNNNKRNTVKNTEELYERLLKEKDERIIELKEQIRKLENKIGI